MFGLNVNKVNDEAFQGMIFSDILHGEQIEEGYRFWAMYCAQQVYCHSVLPAKMVLNDEEERRVITLVLKLINKLQMRDTKKYVVMINNCFTYACLFNEARPMGIALLV